MKGIKLLRRINCSLSISIFHHRYPYGNPKLMLFLCVIVTTLALYLLMVEFENIDFIYHCAIVEEFETPDSRQELFILNVIFTATKTN